MSVLREVLRWIRSQLECVPRRYWLCLLVGFNICILNAVKNIEFRVFDMIVMEKDPDTIPYVPVRYSCTYRGQKKMPHYHRYAQFMWDSSVKKKAVNICRWIHVIIHLPFGIYADLYGGHRMLFWALVASSVITLVTPAAVEADAQGALYFGMFVLRRLTEGPTLPTSMSVLGKWALPDERITFVGIFCSFSYIGHCIGRALVSSFSRWEPLYYLSTALTVFTAVLWWITVKPWHDKLLDELDPRPPNQRVPLIELVTAPRLLTTYLLAFVSHGISLMVDPLILYYLRHALLWDFRVSMDEVLIVSVPLQILGLAGPCLLAGVASDHLVSSGLLGRPAARRILTAVSCAGVALFALLVIAAGCNTTLVVGCYAASMFFNSAQRSLLWTVAVDAAPRLAGTLFALLHAVGCIGIKAKVGFAIWFTKAWGIGDLRVWAALFFAVALIIFILPIPYIVWGPFYEYEWAKLDPTPASIKSPINYRAFSVLTLLAISCFLTVTLMSSF